MKIAFLGPFTNSSLRPFLHNLSDADLLKTPGMGGHGLVEIVEERLSKREETIIITLDTNLDNRKLVRKGEFCSLYSLPKRRNNSLYDMFLKERENILGAIEDSKPDLIHAHWTSEYALAVLKSKIPTLITSHDHPKDVLRYLGPRYYPLYWLSNHIIKKARYMTTVSPYALSYLSKYRSKNSVYIGNPLSKEYLDQCNSFIKGYDYTIPIITSVLDWNELKNPKNAILGFNLLLEKYPFAQLHLFGRNMGKDEECENWCRNNRIEKNVVFHGQVKNEIIKKHLVNTTILLHTSRTESFGMVIAEAMALGVPIIGGINSGAVPQLLDYGFAGLLTDINNPGTICRAMKELLVDVSKRSEIGKQAKERAKLNFDPELISEKLDCVYQKVLNGNTL